MQIPLIDLKRQYAALAEEIEQALRRVLTGGQYIMGPEVKALETEIAHYCGVPHAVGVASGTDALLLALDAAGIGEGDEVITTPYTFFATAEAISRRGAVPVFVDIDPESFNINPALVEEKITPRTKAIIPVHLYGLPAEMEPLMEIARRHNLFVLEDACQAIGSAYRGKKSGSLGDAAAFSFFPTKNLGAYGDGGMLVTFDPVLAEKVRVLRLHGGARKYYHSDLGYNSRLDELQAAVLRVKLRYLDRWNEQRREAAARYDALLEGTGIITPRRFKEAYQVYHLYIVRTPDRDRLFEYLKSQGIGCGIYYPVPLHLQEIYRSLGYRKGDCPEAEKAAEETLALPFFPEITASEQEYVAETIKKCFNLEEATSS